MVVLPHQPRKAPVQSPQSLLHLGPHVNITAFTHYLGKLVLYRMNLLSDGDDPYQQGKEHLKAYKRHTTRKRTLKALALLST